MNNGQRGKCGIGLPLPLCRVGLKGAAGQRPAAVHHRKPNNQGAVMKPMEWTNVDRKEWPAGPWDGEPDKVQWKDEATGLPCIAVRHPRSGHWCGYVGVAEGHPQFANKYDEPSVDVHGGLTYSDFCEPHGDAEGKGICHIAAPGEPDRIWWLGFDCHHCYDYGPLDKINERDRPEHYWRVSPENEYRTLQYVKNQCGNLAQQLAEMK